MPMEYRNKKFYTTIGCLRAESKLTYEISLWELSSDAETVAKRVATRLFSIQFERDIAKITSYEEEMLLWIYLKLMKTPQIEPTPQFFQDESKWKSLSSRLING